MSTSPTHTIPDDLDTRLMQSPIQSPRRLMLCLGLAFCLLSGLLVPALAANDLATDDSNEASTEDPTPTPLTDFAPDEIRPATGKRYDQGLTIQQITVEGNNLIESQKITDAMAIHPGSLYNKQTLQQDLRRVYDLGYFTEKIRAVPIATSNGIHLRIEVTENAPITGFNIEGNTIISDEELQNVFAGQAGLPQNIGQLNESIEKVEKLYADKGYILARVKSINDDPDGMINLDINEGIVNKVQFVGNRKTQNKVIERAMLTKSGSVYNEKLLNEDLQRIYATQGFSDIRRVITASVENPEQYDLTVELDEKKTGAISLGGGVDTATGLFGSVGYNDPNFLGRGQNFSSIVSVGTGVVNRQKFQADTRTYQFDVGWSTPSLFDTANSLSVNVYGRDLASFNVPLGIERRVGTEVAWSRPLQSFQHMAFSTSLRAENVRLREGASQSTLNSYGLTDADRKGLLGSGSFISISPTLAYDTRDNRFTPTTGWLNTVSLTGAYGLSANSYGTVSTNIRRYFKLREGMTLAFNVQAGSSLLGDIPEFNMFRLGGSYTVRGFNEGGLGTGNRFLMGSAELRTKLPFMDRFKNVPLVNSLNGALFADAGRLFGESVSNNQFGLPGLGASIGAGLRFNIPGVGPIRVDYAIPISGGSNRYKQNFNFGVGQKF